MVETANNIHDADWQHYDKEIDPFNDDWQAILKKGLLHHGKVINSRS